uniref:Uncharacterized protein n=1 Tax=Physcomitrium patens TaxID=3218 RepID=A0A2K1JLN4_PHYPA|nr:hypothetical protein PHYPA_017292 [Physcomitrium patens]
MDRSQASFSWEVPRPVWAPRLLLRRLPQSVQLFHSSIYPFTGFVRLIPHLFHFPSINFTASFICSLLHSSIGDQPRAGLLVSGFAELVRI